MPDTTTDSYDLVVVGAGMAGVSAANKCAAAGWRVAIVDALPYGGTCALRGCDPKKILRRGAEIIDSARLLGGKGIDEGGLTIDWADLMAHKRGFTDPSRSGLRTGWQATAWRPSTAPPSSPPATGSPSTARRWRSGTP